MQKNNQPVEKQVKDGDGYLAVNSIFPTIQGEGPFAGTPSVFVRLAGCNLQCPMCDTEYTTRKLMPVDDILVEVCRMQSPWAPLTLVVITGGEPFRQNLNSFINLLVEGRYRVQIETNGTLYQPLDMFGHKNLTIVCSPKAGNINKKLLPHINALKYVATAASIDPVDGLPTHALDHPNSGGLARPPINFLGDVYLQPVDEQDSIANRRNQEAVVGSCLKYGHRLCLQTHKIIGVL